MGALALPWDDRFTRAHLKVPTFGHHAIRNVCSCEGSGQAVAAYVADHPEAMDVLAYYDAATAASHIEIPVFGAPPCLTPRSLPQASSPSQMPSPKVVKPVCYRLAILHIQISQRRIDRSEPTSRSSSQNRRLVFLNTEPLPPQEQALNSDSQNRSTDDAVYAVRFHHSGVINNAKHRLSLNRPHTYQGFP